MPGKKSSPFTLFLVGGLYGSRDNAAGVVSHRHILWFLLEETRNQPGFSARRIEHGNASNGNVTCC